MALEEVLCVPKRGLAGGHWWLPVKGSAGALSSCLLLSAGMKAMHLQVKGLQGLEPAQKLGVSADRFSPRGITEAGQWHGDSDIKPPQL